MDDKDWEAMIVTAKAGNPEARVALVDRALKVLRPFAKKKMADRFETSGDERFQETWVQAVAKFDQFEGATFGKLRSWVWTILNRRIFDGFRRLQGRRRFAESLPPDMPGNEKTPRTILADEETILANEELVAQVNQAVKSLDQKAHEVIRLHFQEGLKCNEIAERLGCTEETAKKRLQRATQRLRVAMTGRAAIPSPEG